jgi:trigger factor
VSKLVLNEKKLENAIVELEIEVPLENVEEEYKAVFRDVTKSAKIDGFRKGKAPVQVIEKKYREYADQHVAENLAKSMVVEAIREKELQPISEPKYNYDHISRDEPFRFKATFEIYPTVELGKYKHLAATEKSCQITDADVEKEIDSISERYSTVEGKEDSAVENGDMVNFKMKRIDNIDESERDSLEYKDYTVVVGKSQDEHALDKHLLGMKKDEEQEVEIKYPKDYQVKDLAGQKVKYLVMINTLNRIVPPERNDEFAQKAGFDTFDEMVKKNRESLENYVDEKIKSDVRGEILKAIVENSKFDIPSTMVLNEMYRIFQRTQERIGYNAESIDQFARMIGMDPEDYKNKLKDDAEHSVKTSVSLGEISKVEEIKVSDEEYRAFLEKLALRNNKSVEELEKIIEENNSRSSVESDIIIEKTLDFLYDNAKIKKLKPVSLEELVKEQVT